VKTQLQSKTAGGLQTCFQNLRTTLKLKLPHLNEGEADQAAAAERQKKKKKKTQHYLTMWQDYDRALA
jgi:hypothetical protein